MECGSLHGIVEAGWRDMIRILGPRTGWTMVRHTLRVRGILPPNRCRYVLGYMGWQRRLNCVSVRAVSKVPRSCFSRAMLLAVGMEHGCIQRHLLDLLSRNQVGSRVVIVLNHWSRSHGYRRLSLSRACRVRSIDDDRSLVFTRPGLNLDGL